MKIAWLTPLNLHSAIGRYSASTTRELARRGNEIEIIHTEVIDCPQLHPTNLPVRHWQEISTAELRDGYDLVVVNIGDNYHFHGGIFDALDTGQCLGIFHDFYIYNLFNGWLAADNGARSGRYDSEIRATYGAELLPLARDARAGAMDPAQIARHFPMTEWLAGRCAGALAHAHFYCERIRAACAGPVSVAHLPWQGRNIAGLPQRMRDHVVAITVGVLNANKCADQVIRAIGQSEKLKTKLRYRLIGAIEPAERARLEQIARSCNYAGLSIMGAADDATLEREIEEADIVLCLRHPVLEGASASAIEAMLSGRPTVVANAGFYGELPDELVFKLPAAIETAPLRETLERLVGDEPLRRTTGKRARDWAEDHFSFARYVDVLEPLARQTLEAQPLVNLSRAIAAELLDLGLAADDPAIGSLAGSAQSLFAATPGGPGAAIARPAAPQVL